MKSMDLESYREVLRTMASNRSGDYVKGDSSEAIRVIIAELFRKANKSAVVVARKMSHELFCHSDVTKEVRDFLEIRGGHVKVVIIEQGGCEEEFRDALDVDADDDHLGIYQLPDDGLAADVEFVCVDREAFVIMKSVESGALATFNRPDAAAKIATVFSAMLKKSRHLVPLDQ